MQSLIGLAELGLSREILEGQRVLLLHALNHPSLHVLADQSALPCILSQVGLLLQDEIDGRITLTFSTFTLCVVLDKILLTVFIFSKFSESIFDSLP